MFSLIASLAIFVVSLGLIGPVWSAAPGKFALENKQSWIQTPAINYHIGLDGISLWLVILSTLLTPLCVLVSWKSIDKHIKQFFAFLLLLEFGLIGVFCALDFFLFFVFWEVSLVPMYFLIGIWGHERRIYSAIKFFLYTMAGSALMLVAIIYLYNPGRHVRLHARSWRGCRAEPFRSVPPSNCGCSWASSSPSPSRFRSSRCTPGCPTRTWKLPPRVR